MGSCASREPALLPSAAAGASDRSDASAADERIDTVVTVFDDAVYYWRVLPSAVLFAEWGSYWRIVAGVGEASATRAGVSEHEAERLFSMSLASREKHVDMYVSVTHTVGRWRAHMALLYVRHHAAAAQLSLLCAGICASWALLLRVVFDQRLPALTAVLLLVALPALCYCARLLLGPRLSLGFHAFHRTNLLQGIGQREGFVNRLFLPVAILMDLYVAEVVVDDVVDHIVPGAPLQGIHKGSEQHREQDGCRRYKGAPAVAPNVAPGHFE